MDVNNLTNFVTALNALPDSIKYNRVDMLSIRKPTCKTIGCHAGLVYFVSKHLPALKKIHRGFWFPYSYSSWADALAEYLGFEGKERLAIWAMENPALWGNSNGSSMFSSESAFEQSCPRFEHAVIIAWWSEVLKRVQQYEKCKN